jgi:hypothetical protein
MQGADEDLRTIATELRRALKDIASFYNPAGEQDSGQAAARRARATLEHLGLLHEDDARRRGLG